MFLVLCLVRGEWTMMRFIGRWSVYGLECMKRDGTSPAKIDETLALA